MSRTKPALLPFEKMQVFHLLTFLLTKVLE